jgi:hypothetical protein
VEEVEPLGEPHLGFWIRGDGEVTVADAGHLYGRGQFVGRRDLLHLAHVVAHLAHVVTGGACLCEGCAGRH